MGCKFQLHNDKFLPHAEDVFVWCFTLHHLS